MQIVYLVAGGRAGSDFFQGFLDGHSQILQFPGLINHGIFKIFEAEKAERIAKIFIQYHPQFFNSKISGRERHDRLGKKKNKFYKISKKKFISEFVSLFNKKKITKYRIIKYLHLAYNYSSNQKQKKKKIIFLHTHLYPLTKDLIKFLKFKNTSIIFTYRHPVASIGAAVKNWLKFKNGSTFFARGYYFQLDIVTQGISNLVDLKKKLFIVQLEKLHRENKRVITDFCRIFKIKYENSMSECTFHGHKWWGDSVSGKWLSGVNKNFTNKIDKNIFFDRDIEFLENLCAKIMTKYKYDNYSNKKNILFNFLPMKSEILVWQNTFKHFSHRNFKFIIKSFIGILFFYFKRILIINKFNTKIKFLPYSLGSKK
ncbi:hypothetical protein OAN91_00255 [Pelagibacteraceae bacterium]|jgi:hypothetical protein|nr:hypothetical protein [Pelagibacteraceae bacterium]